MRSWSNIVTICCLIVVAVIEAYQQALSGAPKAAAHLPAFDGMWNFAPLALLLIAGVFWLVGHVPKRHATGALIVAPKSAVVVRRPIDRVFTSVSPEKLCQMYKEHTSYDADRLAEPYLNAWIAVSGQVFNASVEYDGPNLTLHEVKGVTIISCTFGAQAQQRVLLCKKGDTVSVNGKIRSINQMSLRLFECEFA